MNEWPINLFDTAVILIILLSGGLAFMRGFTREILSLLAWAGAAAATYAGFPLLSPIGHLYVSPSWLADGVSAMAIFVPALLILWMLSSNLSQRVKNSAVGALDRTLGFIFGVGRGAVMATILFLGMGWLIPMEPEQPEWLSSARTLPLVEYGAGLFMTLPPPKSATGVMKIALPEAQKQTPDSAAETGYKTGQRRSLEQLIKGGEASP